MDKQYKHADISLWDFDMHDLMTSRSVSLTISLPISLVSWIDRSAGVQRVTRAEAVRDLIRKGIARDKEFMAKDLLAVEEEAKKGRGRGPKGPRPS